MAVQEVYLKKSEGDGSSKIHLDGADDILWAFETGGSSPQVPLRVSDHVDRMLIGGGALGSSPTKWDLVFVESGQRPVTIQKVWLNERRRSIGPNKALWFMSDRRSALSGIMVDTTFNKLRVANEYARPNIQDGFVNENISKFSQVSLSHFVPPIRGVLRAAGEHEESRGLPTLDRSSSSRMATQGRRFPEELPRHHGPRRDSL